MRARQLLLASALSLGFLTSCGGDVTLIKNPRIDVTNGVCYNYSNSECTIKLNDSRLKWDVQENLTVDKFGFPSEIAGKDIAITRLDDSQIKFTFSGTVDEDFAKDGTYSVSVNPSIIKGITVEDAKFEICLMKSYFQISAKYDFSNDQYAFDGHFKGFEVNRFFSFTECNLSEVSTTFSNGSLRISQAESSDELLFYIYGYGDSAPVGPAITLNYDCLKYILNGLPKNVILKINFDCEDEHLYLADWRNTFFFKVQS